MSINSNVIIRMMVLVAATVLLTQCADNYRNPNQTSSCNSSQELAKAIMMKEKLKLSDKQAADYKNVLHEFNKIAKDDRRYYKKQMKGDDKALINAAKKREEKKMSRIESILDENQKAKFREMYSQKKLSDRTILFAEYLGLTLDSSISEQLEEIVKKSPSDEEALDIKKSGDAKKMEAFKANTQNIHKEIEALLTPEQVTEFRKMIDEKSARMGS